MGQFLNCVYGSLRIVLLTIQELSKAQCKPRFKYVCPGYRKKECNFKAVDGVLLDEFVVQQLSDLSDENSERFKDILEIKIDIVKIS